jgi:hypothetical protein
VYAITPYGWDNPFLSSLGEKYGGCFAFDICFAF